MIYLWCGSWGWVGGLVHSGGPAFSAFGACQGPRAAPQGAPKRLPSRPGLSWPPEKPWSQLGKGRHCSLGAGKCGAGWNALAFWLS